LDLGTYALYCWYIDFSQYSGKGNHERGWSTEDCLIWKDAWSK
jgi:hypothetical protein